MGVVIALVLAAAFALYVWYATHHCRDEVDRAFGDGVFVGKMFSQLTETERERLVAEAMTRRSPR